MDRNGGESRSDVPGTLTESQIDEVLRAARVRHETDMADSEFADTWSRKEMRQQLAEAAYEAGMMYDKIGNELRARHWLATASECGSAEARRELVRIERQERRHGAVIRVIRSPAAAQPQRRNWRHLVRLRAGRRSAAGTAALALICVVLFLAGQPARSTVGVQVSIAVSGLFVGATAVWVATRRSREWLARRGSEIARPASLHEQQAAGRVQTLSARRSDTNVMISR